MFFFFLFLFFYYLFILPLAVVAVKKDFEGLIDVFIYKGGPGVLPRKILVKSIMQEKPSTTILILGLFFIFLFFINQFSLFFSAIL